MDEIKRYLCMNGVRIGFIEGSASQSELDYLRSLARKIKARRVAEIGFNAGFSAYALLAASPETIVTSFDIGQHSYTALAKQFIDKKFPGRHELVIGDSRHTIPRYKAKSPFDLVFVDGGHSYKTAKADLQNMRRLCATNTAIVMDDLVPWLYWGIGPTLAWREMLKHGKLRQAEMYQDGRKVQIRKFPAHRIWALGFYT